MSRIRPGRLAIILTWLAAAPATAQQTSVDLDPVDQAIEDVSVLSTSLRKIEPGLGQPNDFARVFRVNGRQDLYMRQQGGLYAVFPESEYGPDKEGRLQSLIPDGTVFYIGRPALLDPEPMSADPAPEGLIQGRIDLRVKGTELFSLQDHRWGRQHPSKINPSPLPPVGPPIPTALLPPIVSDEAYREERLRSLMRRAAGHAARGRSSSSK
ncbi:MAG: hypothetical protein ACYSU7_10210 [Planctomycetota bacterium]|jgi:hypothetical protein